MQCYLDLKKIWRKGKAKTTRYMKINLDDPTSKVSLKSRDSKLWGGGAIKHVPQLGIPVLYSRAYLHTCFLLCRYA